MFVVFPPTRRAGDPVLPRPALPCCRLKRPQCFPGSMSHVPSDNRSFRFPPIDGGSMKLCTFGAGVPPCPFLCNQSRVENQCYRSYLPPLHRTCLTTAVTLRQTGSIFAKPQTAWSNILRGYRDRRFRSLTLLVKAFPGKTPHTFLSASAFPSSLPSSGRRSALARDAGFFTPSLFRLRGRTFIEFLSALGRR